MVFGCPSWYGEGDLALLSIFQKDGSADLSFSWAWEQVTAAILAGIVPEQLQTEYTRSATMAQFCALDVAV